MVFSLRDTGAARTGNATLAALAFSLIPGAVSERGQMILTKFEALEDTVKPAISQPGAVARPSL